ncbi:hypothetical protein DRE_00069 [Drechslerella stenobrocha 248]|uniref:Zn(2)-C6 fungal-type domain-containing protein n=1 Tax=Drechslerella stenobrocha 248 TaxID=1043628 RepID=W7HZ24_9PEZI|nr:hypothetical protein DRE_00069 [Drechslerella stenobrocha 248]
MESNNHTPTSEQQAQTHANHVTFAVPTGPSLLPPAHEASTSTPASPPPGNIDPSLAEPSPSDDSTRPVRKRNRKSLSCKPCRNMKVKCDRSMPCDRCTKNNRINDCIYDGEHESKKACILSVRNTPNVIFGTTVSRHNETTATPEDTATGKSGSDSKTIELALNVNRVGTAITHYSGGKAWYVGGSHWVHLFGEFGDIGTWNMNDFAVSRKEIKFLKKSFKKKQRQNFPFCASPSIDIKAIPSYVPERHLAEAYINRYLETFERTHPLFHEPTFRNELESFWQDKGSKGMAWMATLFMMMYLGCWFQPFSRQKERDQDALNRLLDAAQTCFLSCGLRTRTTLEVVRAYSIVIIAKQCDAISHGDSDTVSVTMAMLTQMAFLGGVHRDPDYYKEMPPLEKFMRRRIWNTVLYMNFQNSMDGGMPFLLHSDVYDCPVPLNQNENDFATDIATRQPSGAVTDSTHQIILRSVLVIGSGIVTPINNANSRILPYDVVMKYDYRLTRILDDLPNSLSPERYTGSCPDYRSRLAAQRTMVEFFIRSILLVLHRPYAQGVESEEQYPNSYEAALKHATRYIASRKQLFSDNSVNSANGIWIAEVFKEMFTLSALLCYIDVRRRTNLDFLDDGLGGLSDEKYKCIIDSQTMSEQEATISEHHFQLYFATALKFPSLFMKEGKSVIFSKQYVANLNEALRQAAGKVRVALKLPPANEMTHVGDEVDEGSESVPGIASASETIGNTTPLVVTPDRSSDAVRVGQFPDQFYNGNYDAMPIGVFDTLMNDPNLMLDEFFTSFVFGGFQ